MTGQRETDVILEVSNLHKHFPIQRGVFRRTVGQVKAVDGVSFFIREGEAFGLVGESGCGKTTTARCLVRLYEPTSGQVQYRTRVLSSDGSETSANLLELDRRQMTRVRSEITMVFQDPVNSLNPRMSVSDIIREPMSVHQNIGKSEGEDRIVEALEAVGLEADHMRRYPHEFSGGQRQRIGIARALALRPRLIICDEPVSALDVSIQAQILNLLQDLQHQFNLTYLFIAHDLSVVKHISDRVAVMYVSKLVEMADTEALYAAPRHPYTEALLSSVPRTDPLKLTERPTLSGEIADPANPPTGCYFHPRCRYAESICKAETPGLREISFNHYVSCHRAEELRLEGIATESHPEPD